MSEPITVQDYLRNKPRGAMNRWDFETILKEYASIKCKEQREFGEKRIVQLLWFYTDTNNDLNADNTINEVLDAFSNAPEPKI